MKKLSLLFAVLVLLNSCKKDDPSLDTPGLLTKSWTISAFKVKTDAQSYDIPTATFLTSFDLASISFDGAGKYTYKSSGVAKAGTYVLSDGNTKLTITDATKTSYIFYIGSITSKSLELNMKSTTLESTNTSDTEAFNSIFISNLFLSAAKIDYKKITPAPKSYQPVFIYTAN